MDKALDHLLTHPGIWRAGDPAQPAGHRHVSTGYPALDAALPGGGWPAGALTEVLHGHNGIGELRLLMPALARLSHQGKWVALIAPPHIPYAPALHQYGIDLAHLLLVHPRSRRDALWAVEQALRTGTCGAVLAWPRRMDDRSLRRLQLAAEEGGTLGVLFRSQAATDQPSPAALRLQLTRENGRTPLAHILKCRGGDRAGDIPVDLQAGARTTAPATPEAPSSRARPVPSTRPRTPEDTATGAGNTATTSRTPRPARGGHRRAAQLDLPLIEPARHPGRPQATPVTTPPPEDRREGRLARILDKLR